MAHSNSRGEVAANEDARRQQQQDHPANPFANADIDTLQSDLQHIQLDKVWGTPSSPPLPPGSAVPSFSLTTRDGEDRHHPPFYGEETEKESERAVAFTTMVRQEVQSTLQSWIVAVFVHPLWAFYLRGPKIFGGWQGQSPSQICASLAPGTNAHFWDTTATAQSECVDMVRANFDSLFVLGLVVVWYTLLFIALISCAILVCNTGPRLVSAALKIICAACCRLCQRGKCKKEGKPREKRLLRRHPSNREFSSTTNKRLMGMANTQASLFSDVALPSSVDYNFVKRQQQRRRRQAPLENTIDCTTALPTTTLRTSSSPPPRWKQQRQQSYAARRKRRLYKSSENVQSFLPTTPVLHRPPSPPPPLNRNGDDGSDNYSAVTTTTTTMRGKNSMSSASLSPSSSSSSSSTPQ